MHTKLNLLKQTNPILKTNIAYIHHRIQTIKTVVTVEEKYPTLDNVPQEEKHVANATNRTSLQWYAGAQSQPQPMQENCKVMHEIVLHLPDHFDMKETPATMNKCMKLIGKTIHRRKAQKLT